MCVAAAFATAVMWPHNLAAVRSCWETRWLLLLFVMCDMTNGGVQGPMEGYNSLEEFTTPAATTMMLPTTSYTHPKWIEPYFDPSTPRNVTALMGKSAYLSCRVRNLGNKTVSWIRHRDIHILTVGAYTYTSDQRFQATHHQDTDDWTLQIKWAQKRDAGMYECQISTQPVRSYFVRLNVVVPTATILGGPDLHVDKGSTINLTCTVKFSPEPPAYIFWYHHEEVINYDSSRGGVSVITEKGDVTTSFLLIQNADLADSGKYSCAPSNADVASVRVHVLNGEHPEAMQTGSSGCQYSWLTIFLLVCLVLCYNQQNLAFNAAAAAATATATATNTTTITSTSTTTCHTATKAATSKASRSAAAIVEAVNVAAVTKRNNATVNCACNSTTTATTTTTSVDLVIAPTATSTAATSAQTMTLANGSNALLWHACNCNTMATTIATRRRVTKMPTSQNVSNSDCRSVSNDGSTVNTLCVACNNADAGNSNSSSSCSNSSNSISISETNKISSVNTNCVCSSSSSNNKCATAVLAVAASGNCQCHSHSQICSRCRTGGHTTCHNRRVSVR